MKKKSMLFVAFLLLSAMSFGQAGRITGIWLTVDGDSQIEILRKADNKYYGRIVWLDEPLNDDGKPKVDDKNPDKAMHNRPLIGLEILKGFTYNADKQEWAGGTIYDPENGKTYDSFMRLDGNNTLKLKGFVLGMRFLGRETTWTREAAKRE
jgi:uncharacterized protein (DUF2147 family)